MANVIQTTHLETFLTKGWLNFIDKMQLMRTVLEQVRDSDYPTLNESPPTLDPKVSVSFHSVPGDLYELEIWTEFTAPKDDGVVIGTHVFAMKSTGELLLKETYGTHFLPETP
jgi:hypothetical protein